MLPETKILTAVAVSAVPPVALMATLDLSIILSALIAAIPSTIGAVLIYMQGRKISKSVNGVVADLTSKAADKAAAEATVAEREKEDARKLDRAALVVIETDKDRAAATPSNREPSHE